MKDSYHIACKANGEFELVAYCFVVEIFTWGNILFVRREERERAAAAAMKAALSLTASASFSVFVPFPMHERHIKIRSPLRELHSIRKIYALRGEVYVENESSLRISS